MNVDQWTKLLEVFVSLLQAICWPLIVIIFVILFLYTFRTQLKNFLGDKNISDVTFKAGPTGFEATLKRQQIEVAASLGAALARKQGDKSISAEENAREIVDLVHQATSPEASRKLAGATVLWVDDIPKNQAYERKALAALGIQFTISISTEDALEKLRVEQFDVIISDMGRPPDPRAGYTLLEQLPELNRTTPFIIYAAQGSSPQNNAEARKKGAYGSTNRVQELFEMVVSAIKGS